jgi:hypothetical protein
LNETAVMIRQPSLDIIKLMKQIDWNLPPLKVVLCKYVVLLCLIHFLSLVPAELGVGMSLCLFHVLHYGFRKKMLLVNTPTGCLIDSLFKKKKFCFDI